MLDATNAPTPWAPARARTGAKTHHDDGHPSAQRHDGDPDADHPSLRAVVALACQSVDPCELASGIIRSGDVEVAEASEPLAADLDRLQRELGDGPGRQASADASVIVSDDLRADTRWPSLGPHARRLGIAAVVAIPLTPEREIPGWSGWLTLYSRRPGPFPPAAIALAQTLGLYCSSTVNSALHAENLQAALASRDLIGQAKGIIMARKGVDEDQAFAILQQASQHANRRLRDVAESVVRSCSRQQVSA